MKINVTEHERRVIVYSLQMAATRLSLDLAQRVHDQDATNDGPEVNILRAKLQEEGWDQ